MNGRIFTSTPRSFDVDSKSLQSLSSYLFTRYLHDNKNNELSIFMLSGFIQFSPHFREERNVYQSIFNFNLTVNILLRAFKSFNTIYNSVYTFGCNNLFFNTYANFHSQFISQSVISNKFKTNQYAIYHKSFQYFIIFHNQF